MEFSFPQFIGEIKYLLLNPKSFWKKQKQNTEKENLFLKYIVPFLITLALTIFVGEFFRRSDFFFEYPVLKALREVLLFVLMYFIALFFTKELMKTFGGDKDREVAKKLVVFSMIPLMLVSVITGLFPFLYVIDILGLYGFYIFWLGSKELVQLPESKKNSYMLITVFIHLFIFSFLSIILSQLLKAYLNLK